MRAECVRVISCMQTNRFRMTLNRFYSSIPTFGLTGEQHRPIIQKIGQLTDDIRQRGSCHVILPNTAFPHQLSHSF